MKCILRSILYVISVSMSGFMTVLLTTVQTTQGEEGTTNIEAATQSIESLLKKNNIQIKSMVIDPTTIDIHIKFAFSDSAHSDSIVHRDPIPRPIPPKPEPEIPRPSGPSPFKLTGPNLEIYRKAIEEMRLNIENKRIDEGIDHEIYNQGINEYRRRIYLYKDAYRLLQKGVKE